MSRVTAVSRLRARSPFGAPSRHSPRFLRPQLSFGLRTEVNVGYLNALKPDGGGRALPVTDEDSGRGTGHHIETSAGVEMTEAPAMSPAEPALILGRSIDRGSAPHWPVIEPRRF